MKRENKKKKENKRILLSLGLLLSLFCQIIPVSARQAAVIRDETNQDGAKILKDLLRQSRGAEFPVLLERVFGSEARNAAAAIDENSEQLFQAVAEGASRKAGESLEKQIAGRAEKSKTKAIIAPEVKPKPAKKPVKKPAVKPKRVGLNLQPKLDWRQFAFGFQPLSPLRQDEKPEIKFTETDKEIKAEGENKKSFETKEAKGTRSQKAETRYIKDGKTFGVEIKNTEIIEAVSKADGKSFRREVSMLWGADVAACPDVNGVSAGTGKAKIVSKTIYTEGGATVTMTSEFDLQAKLNGYVNDQAEMTHYDLQLDAYTTNSGYEDALRREIIKEIKIKDGRYGLHYEIPGNTIEVSDGKYGGYRKPAKMGEATARKLTSMTDAETTLVGKAIGPMVPAIWNSANEMYQTAQKNWKNYGCVEVVCKVPKTVLERGEEVVVSAETVHLHDGGKINAQMKAEAYQGQITPESQSATPGATFTFTNEATDEYASSLRVESVSKRGIGKGDVDFQLKKEKEEQPETGEWTGTITAARSRREEREKRSGANLAENGGYIETAADVQIALTARRDISVDATNAFIGKVTGTQETVDYEYDRYKIDEGYCGRNAVPYKGPKEITRTSRTVVDFKKETRVYVEIGAGGGTITFSLPEATGRTVHSYVHQSPCPDHDRANTNEAIDEDVPAAGGSFSFSFPVAAAEKSIKGSITVREDDGTTTVYTWELARR